MSGIDWSDIEWSYLLDCFSKSASVKDAMILFSKKYPNREYNAIRNKIRRAGYNPTELISKQNVKKETGSKKELKKEPAKKTVSNQNILKELKNYIKQHKKIPEKDEFLALLGIQEWQIIQRYGGWNSFIQKASKDGYVPPNVKKHSELVVENTRLKTENTNLQQAVKDLTNEAVTADSLRNLIHDLNAGLISNEFGSVKWLEDKSEKPTSGIPLLMLSDIHFDEVVNPAQIQHMNEFNREIAVKRLQHTFNTTVRLLKKEISKPNYDGIVMALGGDIFSGNIHEELAETNEASIFQSMLVLLDVLVQGINLLKKEFGKVFIPCVTGNHGRLHKKMRFKNRAFDNYEWILYQFLARHFKEDKSITFMIPDGPDAQFTVYDKTICLTHGDQFRGGSGISGIFTPLMLGMARKQKRNAAVMKQFNLLLLGHFHQLITTQNLIVNGCFPAGSTVVTPDGIKNIEDFKVGDEILSRDGSIQKVNHLFKKQSTNGLVHHKVRGLPDPLSSTPNHLIWAIKGETAQSPNIGAKWDCLRGNGDKPQWIASDFISIGDWVHIPCIKGTDDTLITEEEAWMYGLYLAEGSTLLNGGSSKKHHRISLTMHERELPHLKKWAEIFEKKYGHKCRVHHRMRLNLTSELVVSPGKEICQEFREKFGHKSIGKIMPKEFMNLSPRLKSKILEGWILGDGHIRKKDGVMSATTISKALAYQMFQMAIDCGQYPAIHKLKAGGRRKNDSYSLFFNSGQEVKIENGEIFYRVGARYRDLNVTDVYDLEVSGEHTYNVNLVGVHNSVKGLDEYAFSNNFPYEPPQQALVIFHPRKGITHMMAVLCDGYKKEEKYKGTAVQAIF